ELLDRSRDRLRRGGQLLPQVVALGEQDEGPGQRGPRRLGTTRDEEAEFGVDLLDAHRAAVEGGVGPHAHEVVGRTYLPRGVERLDGSGDLEDGADAVRGV